MKAPEKGDSVLNRMLLAAVAALSLAACSKKAEDVTATYSLGGNSGAMTVKAAANGDARIDSGSSTMIRHGNDEYLLGKDSQGAFAAKVSDLAAVLSESMRESGMLPKDPPAQPEFELVKKGEETIADLKGDVWTVKAKDKSGAEPIEAVVDADPALAGVGRAMAMQTHLAAAGLPGKPGPASLQSRVEELLGKGLVLRFGEGVKLEKIQRGPIAASDFALPKTILDKAALKKRFDEERKRMMQAMPQGAGAPGAAPQGAVPAPAAPAPAPAPSAGAAKK